MLLSTIAEGIQFIRNVQKKNELEKLDIDFLYETAFKHKMSSKEWIILLKAYTQLTEGAELNV